MLKLLVAGAASLVSAAVLLLGALVVIGIPLALFEGLFGRRPPSRHGGKTSADRAAQELYERRLRDSRRL
ncbi:hypothetical protein [Sphingomonas sp. SRS2]|uniref:hypothetical protein n=1 Tax=Sphingomonas sp. SRS2 TaxID=133190 RepID=UPI00061847AE|nr:hypothetical protein [Sphingomonas sp. SRS2]KKC24259.1 hypothetical protein WP12_20350 [Sphingomonas sp. SRS2]